MAIETVCIVGTGLIGGSFGLALKKAGFAGRIAGVDEPAVLEKALALGAIDEAPARQSALRQASLVLLAQPVPAILNGLEEIAAAVSPGTLVTDTGSAKQAIVEKARAVFTGETVFLGGHPMAGKEGRGVEIASADLFSGAVWALTPLDPRNLSLPAAGEFVDWLGRVGARCRVIDASEHDRVVAWTSHLPQILSTTLASSIETAAGAGDQVEIAGGGLRDMTRLAASPFETWQGIIQTNHSAIDAAISQFILELEEFRSNIWSDRLQETFDRAQSLRKKLQNI